MWKEYFKLKRSSASGQKTEDVMESSLALPDGSWAGIALINLDLEGAVFALDPPQQGTVAAGDKVRLRIRMKRASRALETQATVAQCDSRQDRQLCRAVFADPERFKRQLDHSFFERFNRRMTFRVSPDPEEVIAVSASWKNGACRGELLNISTSGMALRVDAEAVACLGGQRKIELDFNLPGADPALCLPGTIAYIKALPKGHRIGIKFNYARKLGFHPQEAAIARYVMAQQQKALQRRAHRKTYDVRRD